ncbi:PREDICTED: uncharacterized protein LOC107193203 [Dufourea novaeangliae]|uniref:uncharacterized protein LOC107193203 n=1 Tax=Dufourea novaeangliae TaxID=178035 RepID=UPI000767C931|nr:PREDICTED: uncharacterized protein LOC107193203 [Dufourea novaeangliae]
MEETTESPRSKSPASPRPGSEPIGVNHATEGSPQFPHSPNPEVERTTPPERRASRFVQSLEIPNDPEIFLTRIAERRRFTQLDDRSLLNGLIACLTGLAGYWYEANRHLWETWEDFVEAWRGQYGDPRFQETLEDNIRDRVQGEYEPVRDYITCMQEAIYAEVDRLLDEDIIEPSSSEWSSPIVMVKKANGKYRFCLDFRKVNSVSKKDAYPLPIMSGILDKLRAARYLSTIDLSQAYFQIPLEQ